MGRGEVSRLELWRRVRPAVLEGPAWARHPLDDGIVLNRLCGLLRGDLAGFWLVKAHAPLVALLSLLGATTGPTDGEDPTVPNVPRLRGEQRHPAWRALVAPVADWLDLVWPSVDPVGTADRRHRSNRREFDRGGGGGESDQREAPLDVRH
jgi:hypothetical protein